MKKAVSLSLVLTILCCIVAIFTSCNSKTKDEIDTKVDSNGIKEVVTHIESNESAQALSKCQTFNQKTLESGKNDILSAVIKELNYCISNSTYESKTYWVNEKTIEELKNFQAILSLLPLDDTFTNAPSFLDNAVKLEKFIKWNKYHAENDNYLVEIQEYMDTGASYRNTSWNIAVVYYEKALTICRNAAINFSADAYGCQETADFYNAYGTLIYNVIYDKDNTIAEENEFDRAKEAYLKITDEYINALSEYIEILESFPTNIY